MQEWRWEVMGIIILLREGMEMFLYATVGTRWEWEYGHGNGGEWNRSFLLRSFLLRHQIKLKSHKQHVNLDNDIINYCFSVKYSIT